MNCYVVSILYLARLSAMTNANAFPKWNLFLSLLVTTNDFFFFLSVYCLESNFKFKKALFYPRQIFIMLQSSNSETD